MRSTDRDLQLDSIDRAILNELQHDGRLSNQALAQRVHLSASACLRASSNNIAGLCFMPMVPE